MTAIPLPFYDNPLLFGHAATRGLTIKFTRPLDRFSTVRLDLLEGITAFDGGAFVPWSLTFSVGGQ